MNNDRSFVWLIDRFRASSFSAPLYPSVATIWRQPLGSIYTNWLIEMGWLIGFFHWPACRVFVYQWKLHEWQITRHRIWNRTHIRCRQNCVYNYSRSMEYDCTMNQNWIIVRAISNIIQKIECFVLSLQIYIVHTPACMTLGALTVDNGVGECVSKSIESSMKWGGGRLWCERRDQVSPCNHGKIMYILAATIVDPQLSWFIRRCCHHKCKMNSKCNCRQRLIMWSFQNA
jgi:hypothetical protein